jgi:hypothetical protein
MEVPQSEVPEPVMVQFWFRKPNQIPTYLLNLPVLEDLLSFNPSAEPGVELIDKTFNQAVNLAHLLPELAENGMVITHATVLNRVQSGDGYERDFVVVRFHFFHESVAVPREGVDTFKLAEALDEISAMGYWQINVHRNVAQFGPWLSLSCDGRTQRYIGEDPCRPILCRTDNGDSDTPKEDRTYTPRAANLELHYSLSGFELN